MELYILNKLFQLDANKKQQHHGNHAKTRKGKHSNKPTYTHEQYI